MQSFHCILYWKKKKNPKKYNQKTTQEQFPVPEFLSVQFSHLGWSLMFWSLECCEGKLLGFQVVLAFWHSFQCRNLEIPPCQWDVGIQPPQFWMISPKYGQDFWWPGESAGQFWKIPGAWIEKNLLLLKKREIGKLVSLELVQFWIHPWLQSMDSQHQQLDEL